MAEGTRQDPARRVHRRIQGRVVRAVLFAVGVLAVVTLLALVLGGPLGEAATNEVRGSGVGRLDIVA